MAGTGGPLAVSQEPMVWHEQLVPGSFNLPCLVRRYRGPLDVEALDRAFVELARRHEPLRTTFSWAGGGASQEVADVGPGLRVIELSGGGEVAELLADATGRPFDLARGPLFEPMLVRLGPDDHVLVVRLHHTAFDDWSVDVFRRQLSTLYAGTPLPDPPERFSSVAARQQSFLGGAGGDEQRAWWRTELAGAPLSVQLPIGGGDGPGQPVHVPVPPALAASLRGAAPALRATPFMTVLAAFSMVVARLTGLDDLVLGTVTAHRTTTDTEPLIGCFTKKVPVRLRVGADVSFRDLVASARAALLGALAHQDVGFDAALSEALARPAAEHGVVPQVAVVVQAETPRRARLTLPGITVEPYEPPAAARQERHFSAGTEGTRSTWGAGAYLGTFLLLSLAEGEDEDGMSLIARGVFDRAVVRDLLAHFVDVLSAALAAPDRSVADLVSGLPAGGTGPDEIDFRGFRISRRRLEAALATCPGVTAVTVTLRTDAAGEPRLVASVEPAAGGPPVTLEALRAAQWAQLPGSPWPSALDSSTGPPPLPEHPHPVAGALLSAWPGNHGLRDSYWLDFSFLPAVAAARAAGFPLTDEQIARNRTVETLATDFGVNRSPIR